MTKAAAFWDKIAPKYSRDKIKDQASYEYTLDRTRSYLKQTDRVLELGAGTSSTALLLAKGVGSYVATDISGGMVAIGKEKLANTNITNLEIKVGDTDTIFEQGEKFDAVLGLNLFHLTNNPQQVFHRINSMLPLGGMFISKTPCLADEPSFLKRILIRTILPILMGIGIAPRPVHAFRIATLEAMIEKAGFEIIENGNHPVSPPSRYVVARKT
jgi:ubiquinone/menaquinone biosynthesis C-methylase UbiE